MKPDETHSVPGEGGSLKVLFLPTWYPDDDDPVIGVFTREHARAAAHYDEVRVLHVLANRSGDCTGSVSDTLENGIPVRRVRYPTRPRASKALSATGSISGALSNSPTGWYRTLAKMIAALDTTLRGGRFLAYCMRTVIEVRKIAREGWRPDVIHAHVYGAGFPAVLVGRAMSIPVVVSEHYSDLIRGRLNRFELFQARTVASRADHLLPVSEPLADRLRRLGATRVTVVPNVIDPHEMPPATHRSGTEAAEVIAITSSSQNKSLDILVEATELLANRRRDFRLTVIGATVDDLAELAPRAASLEQQGLVRFLGRLLKREVLDLLARSDFLVHPTLFETFGIVPFEAILCGKPVVTTDIEAFAAIGRAGAGILVAPGDASAFAGAMMRMLDEYGDYDVSKFAAETAARCSYEAVGRLFDSIYREVCRGQSTAPGRVLKPS